jgi:GNAT superfamily N-acetyltransferase
MLDFEVRMCAEDEVIRFERRHGRSDLDVSLAADSARDSLAWAALDDGEPIGLALAHRSEDELFIGRIHVDSGFRERGLGRRLLEAALSAGSGEPRFLSAAANDAAGLALAVTAGLRMQHYLIGLRGPLPREESLLRLAAGAYRFDVDRLDLRAHGRFVDALDRGVRGSARPSDHRAFARDAAGLVFFLNGEFVAYAYVRGDGRIGPMAFASPAYAPQLFSFALVTLQRSFGASWCSLLVPADNVRLLTVALDAGLRIEAQSLLMGDAPLPQAERYAGFHPLIF